MTRCKWITLAVTTLAIAPVHAEQTPPATQPQEADYVALERQQSYTPTEANVKARQWFQDAKFGMFIHWGVYSLLAKGEWVMFQDKMNIEQYEKLPPQFNPAKYDPEQWVKLAKDAGMRYIIFTSKHHDGFAMFDSKVSDYDVADRTPYGKDVLKMLADACHSQGIKLILYHSHLDWHHNDYYPRGRTGQYSSRPVPGEWYRYLDYMDGQVRELLTHYGEIAGVWFDGWWDKPKADWRLHKTYKMIHELQPQALVACNHHILPFPGEDYQSFEKDLPGENTTGFNKDARIGDLPLEYCDTINKAWGYDANDKEYKNAKYLIQRLVKAAGRNCNFVLNVGPKPDGTIQSEFVERLQQIGQWMAANGEAIHGTRGGPYPPRPWGVSTQKGNRVFVHVLDWPGAELALPPLDRKVSSIKSFTGEKEISFQQSELGTLLNIPNDIRDETDTILVVETEPGK